MFSHLNKVLLFLAFLIILFAFSITGRGQGIEAIPITPSIAFGATALPIRIPAPKPLPTEGYGTGFILSSTLKFDGFVDGYPMFSLGSGLLVVGKDPSILQRLKELEDKKITITIKPID